MSHGDPTDPFEGLEPEPTDPDDYPVHLVVSAAGMPMPVTSAPRSIFDLAAAIPRRRAHRHAEEPSYPVRSAQVMRADGVTRVTGAQYPANRWTEERQEQERARRAKQRPPRPSKRARTRSTKLIQLIGDEDT